MDMKPSSTTAPQTFTFGNSSSISLPTPTLAPVHAPFGAFGAFGGGFGSPSPQIQARPLFGAVVALPVSTAAAVAAEDEDAEVMQDDDGDDGHMDAQDEQQFSLSLSIYII